MRNANHESGPTCKSDDIVVMMIIALNDSDDIKQPEAESEDEDEEENESAEHEDARERGFGETIKTGPKAQKQEEEFESEGDEKSLTFWTASHGGGGRGIRE